MGYKLNKRLYLTSRKKYAFLEEQSSEVEICRFLSARRFVTVRVLNIGYLFRASSITYIEDLVERWGFNLSKRMRQWMTSFPTEDVVQFSSVHSLSRVQLFATPWIAARQASLSITNSQSSLRLTSIESVMPPGHLMLGRPLLLLPPIPPIIRVFSNESTLRMRWPKYWSFSFSIIPSKEISGLISFRMDWLDWDETMPNEEGVTSWGTGTSKQGGNILDFCILSAD